MLEVGLGSGLNLPLYSVQVSEIVALEPAPRLIGMARRLADHAKAPVKFITGSAESLELLFVEHGLSPESSVEKWQHRLTPLWKKIGGGCHLDRPIRTLIESGGFAITQLDTGYMKGPKPMTYLYEGRASPT